MARLIRYGIVGTGMMGAEHIRNIQLLPDVRVTALADPEASSLSRAREALSPPSTEVAVFNSAAALAKFAEMDAVIIASPNHTHRTVLEPLFDTRLAILCEKPLCTTLADARWVAQQAQAHPAPFWTGMEYRYMPPAREFILQVHGGRVGRLQMLSIREHRFPFLVKVRDWNRFSRNTGGTMVEKCCHFFDLMRLITQAEAVRVYCSGAMDVNHLEERFEGQRPDIIDNSFTTVEFDNGMRAMLDLCMFADGAEHQEEVSATGDRGRLDVLVPPGEIIFSPRVGYRAKKAIDRTTVHVRDDVLAAGSHHGATYYQHEAFVAAIRGQAPVEVTAQDGLRAVEIGIAAEISAREHRVVALSELR